MNLPIPLCTKYPLGFKTVLDSEPVTLGTVKWEPQHLGSVLSTTCGILVAADILAVTVPPKKRPLLVY